MKTYSLFLFLAIALSLLILFILSQVLRRLIKKQIDEQMKNMIPIKSIRKKVGIKIKWRN